MRFQFESMEFCWLLLSSCITFIVAASLNRFGVLQTTVLFCFYSVFVCIIFFDCLNHQFRKTSKLVFLVTAAACLMNSLILELASENYIKNQWNLHVFEFSLGSNGVDSWTNLEVYVRLNFIQTFFCLKMCYHLHFWPQFSYFVNERRKNVNYEQYSIRTFRSYQQYLESLENGEGPKKTDIDGIDAELDIEALEEMMNNAQIEAIERVESVISQEKRSPSLRAHAPASLQIPMSPGRIVFAKQSSSSGSLGSTQEKIFGISRAATVRMFNLFIVWLLMGHVVGIMYPNVAASVVIDVSMGTLGVICLLNMRFDKFKILLSDVEYYYLIISCIAAWFFSCDLRDWDPLWVFRGTVTWLSIGTFCHFDVLINELKKTLKYGLLIGVATVWLLIAWVNTADSESLHENFHIRSWNVSRIDTWTNLEFYVRISFVFSLFWLKLAYHLWYFEEYFYFNRVYVNIESFLNSPTISPMEIKLQIQTPNTVAAQNKHIVLSE